MSHAARLHCPDGLSRRLGTVTRYPDVVRTLVVRANLAALVGGAYFPRSKSGHAW